MASSIDNSLSTMSPNNNTSPPPSPPRKKLHGRAFYESIGSPKFILAPMVDQSEFAWRMLTRSFMTPTSNKQLLAYTPMLHARMFNEKAKFRDAHFQPLRSSLLCHPSCSSPTEAPYLDGNPSLDRPLFVQFCANNPEELLSAARYVTPFCDAIDLNLGCPQGIARKGHYGAFLQESPSLISSLISTLHTNLAIPITAKIRILETRKKTLEYARMLVEAGASIITIHGRTREMKGHKTGVADWEVIKYIRENLPREVVLFATGNVLRKEDVDDCLRVTGVDGVMSAEGNLCDPGIFAEAPEVGKEGREYWRGRDERGGWRVDAVFRRYMDIIHKYVLEIPPPKRSPLFLPSDPPPPPSISPTGENPVEQPDEEGPSKKKQKKLPDRKKRERTTNPNLTAMQAHLFHLLRPLISRHHHLRDTLARCRAGDIDAFENVLGMVEDVVKEGMQKYENSEGESWEEEEKELDAKLVVKSLVGKEGGDGDKREDDGEEKDESSIETVRGVRRVCWVAQAFVRPLPKEALKNGALKISKKERGRGGDGGVGNGGVEKEVLGGGDGKEREVVEVPMEGLVCG